MPLESVDIEQMQANVRRAVNLLKALSNESRLFVLCQLARGEKSVGELQELVGTTQSGMSQHLRFLRQLNLVKANRKAQTIYYSLNGHEATAVITTLYKLYCPEKATVTMLNAYHPVSNEPHNQDLSAA
ncbi:MAG: ArsR family transcriptional regulator [Rhodospirillales bacterium]|nr:MAG: ArsR family transcriptional regulator [Rhodospirillales bacterium]